MSGEDLTTIIVTTVLSGSIFGAVASLITRRAMARKTNAEAKAVDAKLPAEVDSVVVQGAEAAVLTMRSALESATARIAQLEGERAADARRIADLEGKVEQLRRKVETAERALTEARRAGQELRAELEQFVEEQRGRK